MDLSITPDLLALIAGTVSSLVFSYIPGIANWYNALSEDVKRTVMLVTLALVAVALYVFGCVIPLISGIECGLPGIINLVWIFIQALLANQTTHAISPRVGYKAKSYQIASTTLKQSRRSL